MAASVVLLSTICDRFDTSIYAHDRDETKKDSQRAIMLDGWYDNIFAQLYL